VYFPLSLYRIARTTLTLFAVLFSLPTFAFNEDVEPIVEWEKKQNAEQRLEVFGDDFLGDAIDPHTGSLVFSHTDINLPGNSHLPVSLSRQRSSGFTYRDGVNAEFGDWTLSVPRISVTSLTNRAWVGDRCTKPTRDIFTDYSVKTSLMTARDYSNGIQMQIPGQGNQQVLDDSNVDIWPSSASKVTKQNWYFTCNTASDGGQGLLGHAPNGDTYRFDQYYALSAPRMGLIGANAKNRNVYILAATEVKDVYGNTVTYDYDSSNRLTSITASDGRVITLSYSGTSKLISTATAGDKTWNYSYLTNTYNRKQWMPGFGQALVGKVLSSVTQPDGNSWTLNLDNLSATPAPSGRDFCQKWSHTLSLTHPYGATGTFTIEDTEHRQMLGGQVRRSEDCAQGEPVGNAGYPALFPLDNDVTTSTMSVTSKVVNGPSMVEARWDYDYENDIGPSGTSADERTNWTTVTAPDGYHVYYHAWVSEPLAGKLVRKETRNQATNQTYRTEEYTYESEASVGRSYILTYPGPGDIETPVHMTKKVILQDGDTFTNDYTFNTTHSSSSYSYAKPISQSVKSNVSTTARVTETEYKQDKVGWILSLPEKQTVNGRVTQENTFDNLGRKVSEDRNGALFATYGYNSDGTFKWAEDPDERRIEASDYKRGTPQRVDRADGTYVNQTVDDFGRITSITDALRRTISYTRDDMGRLLTANLPDNWSDVIHSYNFSGAPTHTITKGDAQTVITYDVMFRPKLVKTRDLMTNISTYTNIEHDSAGREIFASFPSSNSLESAGTETEYDALGRVTKKRETVTPFATTRTAYFSSHRREETDPQGHKTSYYAYGYDGPGGQDIKAIKSPLDKNTDINKNVWGELTSVRQWKTTELSGIQSSQSLLDHNLLSLNEDNSTNTIPTLALGSWSPNLQIIIPGPGPICDPAETSSFSSSLANQLLISPTPDPSCDPPPPPTTSVTVSEERFYYYDTNRRLCRISEPDVGDTLYQYDASNWLTSYQKGAVEGSSCSAPSGSAKVTLTRDDVGRITKRNYAHSGTPDINKTFDDNGNLLTVKRGGINWTYVYNTLNLPKSEQLLVDGRPYDISYVYNNDGALKQTTLPSSRVVNFNPDGLGRPRQAREGTTYFAKYIKYHASGQVDTFDYGNGFDYEQQLNARLLPSRLKATNGSSTALDMSYVYNASKLITSMTDNAISGNNRVMTYDGLEQITSATGPWGNANYTYDGLGNLLTKHLGSRNITLSYSQNRVSRSVDTGGMGGDTGTRSFAYDSRGNATQAGGLNFTYDYADQPITVSGDSGGTYQYDGNLKRVKSVINSKTIYNVYNLAGKLVHIDNRGSATDPAIETDYISIGSMTVARIEDGTATYLHHDSLGSPVAGTTAAGTVKWRERYSPYGITLDNDNSNKDQAGYTGHIKDGDTGLTYMQARYYDPVIGRFYSNDPVGYTAANPVMSFNRYMYVNNNPYKYTDPDGQFLQFIPAIIAVAKVAHKAYKAYKSNKRIQKVLKNKQSTGKKGDHTSSTGSKGADKDFKTLTKGSDVKTYENGTKVGKTPDGRTVDKHGSSGKSGKGADVKKGTDSIKIKNDSGKTKTTIRYPENKT